MPAIDVTELFSDADFATTFDVIRSAETVNGLGRGVQTPTTTSGIIGVVEPTSSRDLQRLPEGSYQHGAQTIYTTFRLTTGGNGTAADLIRWPAGTGPLYTVQTIDDWSQWGAGFIRALVTLKDINP